MYVCVCLLCSCVYWCDTIGVNGVNIYLKANRVNDSNYDSSQVIKLKLEEKGFLSHSDER